MARASWACGIESSLRIVPVSVGFLLLTSVHTLHGPRVLHEGSTYTGAPRTPVHHVHHSWGCRMADSVNEYRTVFEDFPAYGSVLLRLAQR